MRRVLVLAFVVAGCSEAKAPPVAAPAPSAAEPAVRAVPVGAAQAGPDGGTAGPDGGTAAGDCGAFCDRLFTCVPEGMAQLDLVKQTFPADCAKKCAALPPAAVACGADHTCAELSVGTCGAEVGGLVRALGGP